jgi:hypothetical protein
VQVRPGPIGSNRDLLIDSGDGLGRVSYEKITKNDE